jgi:hypothetical protein
MSPKQLEAVLETLRREIANILGIRVPDTSSKTSFMELGRNSLSAIALANKLRDIGLRLKVGSTLTALSMSDLAEQASIENSTQDPEHKSSSWLSKRQFPSAESQPGHLTSAEPPRKKLKGFSHCQLNKARSLSVTPRLLLAPITHMRLTFIHNGQAKAGTNVI